MRRSRPALHCLPSLALLLCLASFVGCSTTGSFFSTSSNNRLLSVTEHMRHAAAPRSLPGPRELDKQVLPAYIVEPGDVLLVQPEFDSPVRLPPDQPVLADGTIDLGRYGKLEAAGKTVEQIEAEVSARVEPQMKNRGHIGVRLINRQSKVFYVLGEVNAPGAYPLDGRETVLDAIIAAGGLTNRADQSRIVMSQPTAPDDCRVVLPVCYREIVQLGDTTSNYQLGPGDRVYVPGLSFWDELHNTICPTKTVDECPPCGLPQHPCPPPHGP